MRNVDDKSLIKDVWHAEFFNACKSRLKESAYEVMTSELNHKIDQTLESGNEVVVSSFLPGKYWEGTPWEPIYVDACGYEQDHSAMFFGLLVCKVLIERPETWYFLRQNNAQGMTYFVAKKKEKSLKDFFAER